MIRIQWYSGTLESCTQDSMDKMASFRQYCNIIYEEIFCIILTINQRNILYKLDILQLWHMIPYRSTITKYLTSPRKLLKFLKILCVSQKLIIYQYKNIYMIRLYSLQALKNPTGMSRKHFEVFMVYNHHENQFSTR